MTWATLREAGENEAAQSVLNDCLARLRGALGEDHPDALSVAGELALTMQAMGDINSARALLEDVLLRFRRTLGEDLGVRVLDVFLGDCIAPIQ